MINLPIPDATTSTGNTKTTVGQVEETKTMASVEFLAVWTNSPERGSVSRPVDDGIDITQLGILGLLSKQKTAPSGLQAVQLTMMDIPREEEQFQPDMPKGKAPLLQQDMDEIAKGLPVTPLVPDVSLSPGATISGPIIDKPVEVVALADKSIPLDRSDKSNKERVPKTSLWFAHPSNDAGEKGNEIALTSPMETAFSGTEKANVYVTEVDISKAPAQMGEPIKAALLENKDARLTQVATQQPVRQNKNTDFDTRTTQGPDLPVRQNQPIQVSQAGDVSKPELVQPENKSNASPSREATALQFSDRLQKADVVKQPYETHQDIQTRQEAPKPLPQTVVRSQVPPEQTVLVQPKVSQSKHMGPEIASSVGSIANNQSTAGVVDAPAQVVAAPVPASSPKRGDHKAKELAPIEVSRTSDSGTVKPTPLPNQAIPVTASMAKPDTKETHPFDSNALFETPDLHPVPSHATGLSPSLQNAAMAYPDIPRHIARQLADVARQMPERPVELTLNPHELGRVRLTFTLTDGGINVAVLAERGETMDLMRRHIETLAQEFRDMGYADVGFQFSQHDRENAGGSNPDAQPRQTTEFAPLPEIETTPPARVSLEPTSGLDLRL